jgi:hypothetical protein
MISKENMDLINQFEHIAEDDALAERLGKELAETLMLRRDPEHKDRWKLTTGNKTNIGLARTVARILREAQ